MEWTETLKRTVDYLEEHLLEDGAAEGAAVWVNPGSRLGRRERHRRYISPRSTCRRDSSW